MTIHPGAKTGVHHHNVLECVIDAVRGRAWLRRGAQMAFAAEAQAGDFIFVPPDVPHQEINASNGETLECVPVRSGNEAVAVKLDIAIAGKPEAIDWIDPIHRPPAHGLQRVPDCVQNRTFQPKDYKLPHYFCWHYHDLVTL